MITFKCKMCGGDLHPEENATTCECEYCGSVQTIPTADSEKKMNLIGRAQRLLRSCEFDKAAGVYESVVSEFPEEAEAYWGLVLCKYGIEYVDDPLTGKKIPTCHRSSFDSVMDDANFDQACENADAIARRVYRDEAKQIEEIRKRIIEVSGKEAPYDIFICYKETDENGSRTLDSVIAQDIYDALAAKGYRVFFARISLEDKLGQEYEPYIFAALYSAKIMLAVGTDYEYFNAVWVKNEWSRFLKLIASGEKKTLIPCYKGIDAYDMPKEFARLQAQDMGKVGAMQDLLRGIEKIIPRIGAHDDVLESVPREAASFQNPAVSSYLERARLFLEDDDFENAAAYYDKVLDIQPKSSDAYLGLTLVHFHVKEASDLVMLEACFEQNKNWEKAVRFADSAQRHQLADILAQAQQIRELNTRFRALLEQCRNTFDSKDIERVAKNWKEVGSVDHSKLMILALLLDKKPRSIIDIAQETRISSQKAAALLTQLHRENIVVHERDERGITNFRLDDHFEIQQKDADFGLYAVCVRSDQMTADEIRRRVEVLAGLARNAEQCHIAAEMYRQLTPAPGNVESVQRMESHALEYVSQTKETLYGQAEDLRNAGKWQEAIEIYRQLQGYRDSDERIAECEEYIRAFQYQSAKSLANNGRWEEAILAYEALGDYRDSTVQAQSCAVEREKHLQEQAKRERAEKERREREQQAQEAIAHRKKRARLILALLIAALCAVYWFVIHPRLQYQKGEKAFARQDYEAAYSCFIGARKYQDAPARAADTALLLAEQAMDRFDYAEASNRYEQAHDEKMQKATDHFKVIQNASSIRYFDDESNMLPEGVYRFMFNKKSGYTSGSGLMKPGKDGWATKLGYDTVTYIGDDFCLLGNNTILDVKTGDTTVFPGRISSGGIGDDMVRFWSGNGYGYANWSGETVIEPKYSDARRFSEGVAAVKEGDVWKIIDKNDQPLSSETYDYISSFDHGYAVVSKGTSYGFINTSGKETIQVNGTYKGIETESYIENGLIKISTSSGEALYDLNGNRVSDYYGTIRKFSEGLAYAHTLKPLENYYPAIKAGYLNTDGTMVIDLMQMGYDGWMDDCGSFINGCAIVSCWVENSKNTGREIYYGVINRNGRMLVNLQDIHFSYAGDGVIKEILSDNGPYYLTDNGNISGPYTYEQYRQVIKQKSVEQKGKTQNTPGEITEIIWINDNGVYAVQVDDQWQLFDSDGERFF